MLKIKEEGALGGITLCEAVSKRAMFSTEKKRGNPSVG